MEKVLITGGAGFIGTHLARELLRSGFYVISVDNFSLGSRKNVEDLLENPAYSLIEADASEQTIMTELLQREEPQVVYHLAANSDIKKSSENPMIEYHNTFSTTLAVLEGMRKSNVRRIFFASSSAVYGDHGSKLLSENCGGLMPISYYGAAKLASEVFLSAYSERSNIQTTIFRFANVIGPGLTHGVIFDFVRKLRENPRELEIFGNGEQRKPYLYVQDLTRTIVEFMQSVQDEPVSIFNIGVGTSISVREIADLVCQYMELREVKYCFTGGREGWPGDVPVFRYDLEKITSRGFSPTLDSEGAVRATLEAMGYKRGE